MIPCEGSDSHPRRVLKGRFECQQCQRFFAPRVDGFVRRHGRK